MRADGAEHKIVAIRGRIGDALGAGHATRATDVLDHHLLPEDLTHALRHDAAEHVGRAAGRERNHHRERLGRISLCQRSAREQQAEGGY